VNPGSFVLVGIGGFFAGIARTPISSVIMACEMSASYTLLVPLMLVFLDLVPAAGATPACS